MRSSARVGIGLGADLHALPDCAAELLLAHPALTTDAERTRLLDLLVRSAGFDATYEEHLARFERDPDAFFPRSYSRPPAPAAAPPPASELPVRQDVRRVMRRVGGSLKRRLQRLAGGRRGDSGARHVTQA